MEEDNRNDLYRECLRNHAASLGSYATDGCGEFTLDDTSSPGFGNLKCAACGCHRNFHRKVTYSGIGVSCSSRGGRDPDTAAARTEMIECPNNNTLMVVESPTEFEQHQSCMMKKRFRSKFTTDQKEKMMTFADKLGWKLQRKDQEDEIEKFCREVGVSRQVFKVWMHNHKNSSSSSSSASTANNASSSLTHH